MVFTAQLFQLSVCLKIFIIKYSEKCATKKGIIFHNYFRDVWTKVWRTLASIISIC